MLGSSVLEVAIGLVFVYLVLSALCSGINEWVASLFNKRGKLLFEGIKNLLNDPRFTGLAGLLYNHGIVDGTMRDAADPHKGNRLPSYMADTTFSTALIDILATQGIVNSSPNDAKSVREAASPAGEPPNLDATRKTVADKLSSAKAALDAAISSSPGMHAISRRGRLPLMQTTAQKLEEALESARELASEFPNQMANVEAGIRSIASGHTKETLLVLAAKARHDLALLSEEARTAERQLDLFKTNVETWFNDSMDRVSGWYKRWTLAVQLIIAFIIVAVVNADSLLLLNRLSNDQTVRASVVAAAQSAIRSQSGASSQEISNLRSDTVLAQLPLGWARQECDPRHFPWITHADSGAARNNEMLDNWFLKIVGLLMTGLAVSMGAPFWFDALGKLMSVRGSGSPPQSSAPAPAAPPTPTK